MMQSTRPPDSIDPLEALHTAVVILGSDAMPRYLNPAAEELLGLSRTHSGVGRGLARLLDQTGIGELIEHARRADRTLAAIGLHLETDRAKRVLDIEITPLPDQAVLLELRDATLRQRARKDQDQLARRNLSRRVLGQLAHEIRNPLAGLRGAAQMLGRSVRDAEQQELVQILCDEADRLDRLVAEMLIPTGLPRPRPCCIHVALDRLSTLLAAEAGPGVRIEPDYDPSLPELPLDEDQIIQALLNLGRNALQAGARTITLTTRAVHRQTWGGRMHRLAVAIEIRDDGAGVPDELAESLFFPLVTSKPDGSGLGLAIAQEIMQCHGGQIEYESEPGNTVFRAFLPIATGRRGA